MEQPNFLATNELETSMLLGYSSEMMGKQLTCVKLKCFCLRHLEMFEIVRYLIFDGVLKRFIAQNFTNGIQCFEVPGVEEATQYAVRCLRWKMIERREIFAFVARQ